MIAALMAATVAANAVPTPFRVQHDCRVAAQMRDINMPNNDQRPQTDIAHASVIYVADRFAGYLYRTQEGHTFIHIGQVNGARLPAVTPADASRVMGALGAKPGFYELHTPPLPIGDLSLIACY